MKLALSFQHNLAVNQTAITKSNQQLPHLIAEFYLKTIPKQTLDETYQKCKNAQQRLNLFEPFIELIPILEDLITASQFIFTTSYPNLQQKWELTLEIIGDLTQSQSLVNELAQRLTIIQKNWSLILTIYQQITQIMNTKDQTNLDLLKLLRQQWTKLWFMIPSLTEPNASLIIQQSLQYFTQITSSKATVSV